MFSREAAKRRIGKPLTWACMKCGAPAGEFCISRNGREMTSIGCTHNERIVPHKKPSKSYRSWIRTNVSADAS